jgi:hypothetical protein
VQAGWGIVETEISVIVSQWLGPRIPTKATLASAVEAWYRRKTGARARITYLSP